MTGHIIHTTVQAEDSQEKDSQAVAPEAAEHSFRPPGQLGVPKLKEVFTQMVLDVHDGPKPSGEGRAVEQLNLQDLKDISATVIDFHVATNKAVKAACPNLDEREGKGYLAADQLGVELIPSYEAPTEAHTVGKQVEELLGEAMAANERLRSASKSRRSRLRAMTSMVLRS